MFSLFPGDGGLVSFGWMKGRGKVALAAAAAAVVVTVAVTVGLARRPSAAKWEGKTAAEWFSEFRKAPRGRRERQVQIPGIGVQTEYVEQPELMLNHESAEGLRRLGTNAAIYLGEELMKRDRPFAESYARFHRKLPAVLAKITPSPSEPRAEVRRDAGPTRLSGCRAWSAPLRMPDRLMGNISRYHCSGCPTNWRNSIPPWNSLAISQTITKGRSLCGTHIAGHEWRR